MLSKSRDGLAQEQLRRRQGLGVHKRVAVAAGVAIATAHDLASTGYRLAAAEEPGRRQDRSLAREEGHVKPDAALGAAS